MKDAKLTVLGGVGFQPVKIEFTITTVEELIGFTHRMSLDDLKDGFGWESQVIDLAEKYISNDLDKELFELVITHIRMQNLEHLIYKDGGEE